MSSDGTDGPSRIACRWLATVPNGSRNRQLLRKDVRYKGQKQPVQFDRAAMTLIELLVVIAIIGILVGITASALFLMPGRARQRATESLIARLDTALNQRLQEARERGRAANPLAVDTYLAGGNPGRAQAIALTRVVRQELPEIFLLNPAQPYRHRLTTTIAAFSGSPTVNLVGDFSPLDFRPAGGPLQPPGRLPPRAHLFPTALQQALSGGKLANHDPLTTRAECLYLIVNGGLGDSGESEFHATEVRDTDQDGLPEFVDAWGNPILFFLWPIAYRSELQPMVKTSSGMRPRESGNPNDPSGLLTDPEYFNSNFRALFEETFHPLSLPPGSNTPFAYRSYPLIISAGPDGRFGLVRDAGPDGQPGTGDDGFILPIALRVSDVMPLPANHPELGADADNIDNHSLRAR